MVVWCYHNRRLLKDNEITPPCNTAHTHSQRHERFTSERSEDASYMCMYVRGKAPHPIRHMCKCLSENKRHFWTLASQWTTSGFHGPSIALSIILLYSCIMVIVVLYLGYCPIKCASM